MIPTNVIFKPDGIHVQRWTDVQDVRIFAILQIWNAIF